MRNLQPWIAAGFLLCQGCEEAHEFLGVEEIVVAAASELLPGGRVDGELGALVVRQDGGVRFRRDLPYPDELAVERSREVEFRDVRKLQTNAFGRESLLINQVSAATLSCRKSPGRFLLKPDEIVVRTPVTLDNGKRGFKDERTPEEELSAQEFVLTQNGWKSRQRQGAVDFRSLLRGGELEPVLPEMMVTCGVHPRSQWLSSSRLWKPGDELVLTGSALKMIHAGDVSGKATLTFEGEEPINGHPCGVFRVVGDYDLREAMDYDGLVVDETGSLEEGRIWASLLYPVLLRTEFECIVTRVEKTIAGGPPSRLQGRLVTTESLAWHPSE